MIGIRKIIGLFPVFLFAWMSSFSQLTFAEMQNIELGQTFKDSKPAIKKMFSGKSDIWKSDFLGAYRIQYTNVPFDYYGNADYCFQYVKDTLVAIRTEFTFKESDTLNFKRLLNTVLNEFNKDKSKKILKEYSDINLKQVLQFISKKCISSTIEMKQNDGGQIDFGPIRQNVWALYNNDNYQGKFLVLYVKMGAVYHYSKEDPEKSIQDGCELILGFEITNEYFQDLKHQEENLTNTLYLLIKDDENRIDLKFKNGVYSLPVKINNILSIDFILDPGASDVSISPDIFLVLYKAGTIQENDFIGRQTYQFADGSSAKSSVFNIESLQIGEIVLKNVRASISNNVNSPLLLGQSALRKFSSYKIDNENHKLIIE